MTQAVLIRNIDYQIISQTVLYKMQSVIYEKHSMRLPPKRQEDFDKAIEKSKIKNDDDKAEISRKKAIEQKAYEEKVDVYKIQLESDKYKDKKEQINQEIKDNTLKLNSQSEKESKSNDGASLMRRTKDAKEKFAYYQNKRKADNIKSTKIKQKLLSHRRV
jgi:hypothetical protein